MDLNKLLKSGIVLTIAILFNFRLVAQETITFTWDTFGGKFELYGTANKEFTIDWGDSIIETKTPNGGFIEHIYATPGEYTVIITDSTGDCLFNFFSFSEKFNFLISRLNLTGCSVLQTLYCYNGLLEELDLSGCPELTTLGCAFNQINKLDLSGCPKFEHLACYFNHLQKLNLTGCSNLQSIICWNNQLQLSDLFAASLLIKDPNKREFGKQNLSPQTAILGEELFSEQSVFNGIFTNYSVIKNDSPAPESDYTVINGKLIFNAVGKYTVTMTNDAIVSYKSSPAKVIVEIIVEKGMSIAEPKINNLTVYPNPATKEIHVKLNYSKPTNYSIFNTAGQSVLHGRLQEETTINVESLSKGIYYINSDDKGNTTVSFIKK